MNAKEVLRQVAHIYQSCKYYRDKGWIKNSGLGLDPRIRFETFFIRPDKFRIELFSLKAFKHRKITDTSIITANGDQVWSYNSEGGAGLQKEHGSIRHAVAAATGTSSGGAYLIASLLMKEFAASPSILTIEPKEFTDVLLSNTRCHLISGSMGTDWDADVWIDSSSFVIKKVQWTVSTRPGSESYVDESGDLHPMEFETTFSFDNVEFDHPFSEDYFTPKRKDQA